MAKSFSSPININGTEIKTESLCAKCVALNKINLAVAQIVALLEISTQVSFQIPYHTTDMKQMKCI